MTGITLKLYQGARWSLITALDIATESLTLVLPSFMVWQVQMKVETKLRVIAAFSCRLRPVSRLYRFNF